MIKKENKSINTSHSIVAAKKQSAKIQQIVEKIRGGFEKQANNQIRREHITLTTILALIYYNRRGTLLAVVDNTNRERTRNKKSSLFQRTITKRSSFDVHNPFFVEHFFFVETIIIIIRRRSVKRKFLHWTDTQQMEVMRVGHATTS